MGNSWQLQRAKAEFSRLIDECLEKGPQVVTRHGKATAVILSLEDYQRLRRRGPDFKAFLRSAPVHELQINRSKDTGRKVAF